MGLHGESQGHQSNQHAKWEVRWDIMGTDEVTLIVVVEDITVAGEGIMGVEVAIIVTTGVDNKAIMVGATVMDRTLDSLE